MPLRMAGRSWTPGCVVPSLWPGGGHRQPLVILGPAGGPKLVSHHHSLLVSISKPPGKMASAYPESTAEGHGPSVLLQDQRMQVPHPRTWGSQRSMKDTVASCCPEKKHLSKRQSVRIGTWGSSIPGSRGSAECLWRLPGNPLPAPRHRTPVPTQTADQSCLCSVSVAPLA